jgi:hypothetical protein
MTNLEAVYCEVKPYCSADNQLELEKALLVAGSRLDVALDAQGDYSPSNERCIALAAVLVLAKYISLASETESQWSQSYNDKLEDRIKQLCRANGLDEEEFLPSQTIRLTHASNRF